MAQDPAQALIRAIRNDHPNRVARLLTQHPDMVNAVIVESRGVSKSPSSPEIESCSNPQRAQSFSRVFI